MSETRNQFRPTPNGNMVTRTRIIGTDHVTYSAWRPVESYFCDYITLQTINGQLHGQIGSLRLGLEPQKAERRIAISEIIAAFPHAGINMTVKLHEIHKQETLSKNHDCKDHPVFVETDGALGHGWECEICGEFLQAG